MMPAQLMDGPEIRGSAKLARRTRKGNQPAKRRLRDGLKLAIAKHGLAHLMGLEIPEAFKLISTELLLRKWKVPGASSARRHLKDLLIDEGWSPRS